MKESLSVFASIKSHLVNYVISILCWADIWEVSAGTFMSLGTHNGFAFEKGKKNAHKCPWKPMTMLWIVSDGLCYTSTPLHSAVWLQLGMENGNQMCRIFLFSLLDLFVFGHFEPSTHCSAGCWALWALTLLHASIPLLCIHFILRT